MRRAILSAVTALVIGTLSACGGGGGTPPSGPSVTVTPSTANVQEGGNQQFTASVTGTSSTGVNWQVNGVSGGSAATGFINGSGLYTAPAVIPKPANITITAVLQSDSSVSGNSIVTITAVQFNNSSLNGNYVFSLSGVGTSGLPFYIVGTVSANGKGNITGGEADWNSVALGYIRVPASSITGNYNVGSDGRGILNLNMPALSGQQFTYAFALKALDNAVLNEVDGQVIAGTGNLETQSGPLLTPANFAFGFSGVTGCGAQNSAGIFNLSSNKLTGVQDVNSCTSITQAQSLTGSYSNVDTLGRGLGNFSANSGSANFVYYVTTTGSFRFMSITSGTYFLGGSNIQVQASFANSDFSGGYVINTSANTQSVPGGGVSYTLIQMAASNGSVSSGYYDVNDTGTVGQASLTGAYNLNPNGRINGSFTVNGSATLPFAMYLYSPSQGYYVDERRTAVGGGSIYGQNSAVNTNSAWLGSYATRQFGYFVTAQTIIPGNATAITGQISSNGSGTLAGTLDIVDPVSNYLQPQTLQGTYNITNVAPGRMTVAISTPADGTRNYVGYIVDQTRVLLLDVDASILTAGGDAVRQF